MKERPLAIDTLDPSLLRQAIALPIHRPVRGAWLQLFPPTLFEWNHVRIPIPGLPRGLEGLRILHLTDLHVRPRWRKAYDDLLSRIGENTPDLLLVTGDFVDHKHDHSNALPTLYRLLDGFCARLGCYGILGNHDTETLGPELTGTGASTF